ncbi:MAG: NmrA family NAD(P)-binding protein [Sphingobium sp.]|nr:NmrA family NAD(P)-binding protein [Sphingobium sp.]MCP5400033.1 NmrA family NAD(P)-binding protein [Sphingomonas sp.]
MILVTSANGNQGKQLLPRLTAAGLAVRALVRTEASAEALAATGINDIIVGDMGNPAVLAQAMQGIEKVYHIGPSVHPQERAMGFAAIDAARAAGVQHFVFSSVLHAITTDFVQHEIKRDIEEHLISSGLEFTILQPTNYMSPIKLRPVFEKGVFRLSWSLERRQSLVDLADVAEVATMVLTDSERHAGATYELVAPGRYNAHDLGAIISKAVGRPVPVEQVHADTFLREMFGDVTPEQLPHETRVLRSISARNSSHDFIGNPNVLTWLLGREPTSYEQFVRRTYEAYLASGKMLFSTAR